MIRSILFTIAIVSFIIVFIKNVIQLIVKIKKGETFHREIIILLYLLIITLCVDCYIFIGTKIVSFDVFDVQDMVVGGIYFVLAITLLAKIIWSFIGLFSKVVKERLKKVYGLFVIPLSIWYLMVSGNALFYSTERMVGSFYENIKFFEEFSNYIKNSEFQGYSGGDGYYSIDDWELWYHSESLDEKIEDKYLKDLFIKIQGNCAVKSFTVYNNRDVSFLIENDYGFQYTNDEGIEQIFASTWSIRELDKGWYIEIHIKQWVSRDDGYNNNIDKIQFR